MIEVIEGHEISVRFDRPAPMQLDGETILDVTRYDVKSAPLKAKINSTAS